MFFIPASLPAILSVLVALPSMPTAVGDPAGGGGHPAPPAWELGASVSSATPVSLPGLTTGGSAEVARRLRGGPLFLSGQIGLSFASAANESWTIDHRQLIVAGGVGAGGRLGAGRVWAQVGAGAIGLEEILGRHQLERIQMANVPGGTETTYALGPYAFGEVGVAVAVRGAFSARVSGGPSVSRMALMGGPSWHFGAQAKVGVSYEF